MSNKKNNKNSKQQFPFKNEIKMMKEAFKKSIDEMPSNYFLDLVSFLMFSSENFEDEDWAFDEEWED